MAPRPQRPQAPLECCRFSQGVVLMCDRLTRHGLSLALPPTSTNRRAVAPSRRKTVRELCGVAARLERRLTLDAGADGELFATAFLVEFPGGGSQVRVLSQGHPSAPPTVVPLRPGDVILAYTDGVTEARDASGNFYPPGRPTHRPARGGLGCLTTRRGGRGVGRPAALHGMVYDDVALLALAVAGAAANTPPDQAGPRHHGSGLRPPPAWRTRRSSPESRYAIPVAQPSSCASRTHRRTWACGHRCRMPRRSPVPAGTGADARASAHGGPGPRSAVRSFNAVPGRSMEHLQCPRSRTPRRCPAPGTGSCAPESPRC
ncbi:SpoIIE family protein phosphatase [Streptomyces wuyuanensis]|uniref:SpoIIE family protein phosphatase n=1 Tax=Streptomyces wuyuanensis TaxID=1196353 RepID=UPI003D713F69